MNKKLKLILQLISGMVITISGYIYLKDYSSFYNFLAPCPTPTGSSCITTNDITKCEIPGHYCAGLSLQDNLLLFIIYIVIFVAIFILIGIILDRVSRVIK